MQMMFILYYKLLSYYMDTITILGISLLFFYSLIQILQFYGIDPSIFAIYIIFYVFLIISKLILPSTYPSNFADDLEEPEPIDDADDVVDEVVNTNPTAKGYTRANVSSSSARPISRDEVMRRRQEAASSSSFFGSFFGSSTSPSEEPALAPQQAPPQQAPPQQASQETQPTTNPVTGGQGTADGFGAG